MLKALVWKEFRELLPMCTIALAVQVLLIAHAVNEWRLHSNPGNVAATFPFLYITSLVFAICAGLWQGAREVSQNTYQFLMQRPVERTTVFGVKICFGVLVCFVVGLVPSIAFTTWMLQVVRYEVDFAAVTWGLVGGLWLIYFGALLSGLWPARWYGSRFYPVLAGLLLYILLQVLCSPHPRVGWGVRSVALLLALPVSLGFAIAVLYVGRTRDYS